jgi:NAD(P)-dependent dehydrogenase (short-subunit alcohol dehydrogenase family)
MRNSTKTALVTGANRGLGLETARELSGKGWQLILTARNEAKGTAAAQSVSAEAGGEARFRLLDVADPSSIAAIAGWLREGGMKLDVLVNNAGITMDGFDGNIARRTIDTNFYGPLRVTEALLPAISDGGAIVMVSSSAGEVSILSRDLRKRFTDPGLTQQGLLELVESFVDAVRRGRHSQEGWPTSAYGVSRAALNALVRIAAPRLAERAIRINAVCPGWVRTDMGGPGAPRSLQQGAASILWAALLEGGPTGGFFRDGKPIPW